MKKIKIKIVNKSIDKNSEIIKIRLFSDWASSLELKEKYEKICETYIDINYGNKYIFVSDDSYNSVILFNWVTPKLKPNAKKICFLSEPPNNTNIKKLNFNYLKDNKVKLFLGRKYKNYETSHPFLNYIYPPYNPKNSKKTGIISFCISNKKIMKGHIYRHMLLEKILYEGLNIDIYGTGCELYDMNKYKNLKGSFESWETFSKPYIEYDFTISIENEFYSNYFTEKLVNPLLNNCTPIYLGCNKYFDKEIIQLKYNLDYDISLLKDILKNKDKYKREISVNNIKNKIYLTKNISLLFDNEK